jgi:ELWxxDGT repeat protein
MPFQGGDGESSLISLMEWGDMLLFGINDRTAGPALWRMPIIDGPAERIQQFSAREAFSNFWLTDAGGFVLFMLNDGNDRTELWRTDGTTQGTRLITRLPETNAFEDFGFTVLNGTVHFQATDSLHGSELWKTDGTAGGTVLLADILPGAESSDPGVFTVSDGLLYFVAADGVHGKELWVSDGTAEGTQLLADINPGAGDSRPYPITPIDGYLYLSADDGVAGMEPFRTDGTPEGTRRIADIRDGNGSFPSQYFAVGDGIVCVANDGSGNELWMLDPAGLEAPKPVRDISPLGGSFPMDLVEMNGLLYFSATDGFHGRELWRSDGTESGTWMVSDLIQGQASSSPGELTPFRGRLFFTATDSSVGQELRVLAPLEVTVCNGASATLSVGNSEGTVRWYTTEDATAELAEGTSFTTPALHRSATYWTDVTVGGCRSLRSPIAVRVPAPDPEISDTSGNANSSIILRATAESGRIQWFRTMHDSLPLATGPELTLLLGMQDTVVYVRTVEDGCSSTLFPLRVRVEGTSSIPAPPTGVRLHSWPQPVSGILHVHAPNLRGQGVVTVRDMLGRLRLQSTEHFSGGRIVQVSCAVLGPGPYILRIEHRSGIEQLLFVRR